MFWYIKNIKIFLCTNYFLKQEKWTLKIRKFSFPARDIPKNLFPLSTMHPVRNALKALLHLRWLWYVTQNLRNAEFLFYIKCSLATVIALAQLTVVSYKFISRWFNQLKWFYPYRAGVSFMLLGCEGFNAIEEYGKSKEDWFRQFLDLHNGIPSHDTFNDVINRLDPQAAGLAGYWWFYHHDWRDGLPVQNRWPDCRKQGRLCAGVKRPHDHPYWKKQFVIVTFG